MQIHLFDCKSTVALRRGLGKNKLSLCMLLLSQLRNTYWSASVIFRLFERAQIMLDKSNRGMMTQSEGATSDHSGTLAVNNSKDITEYQRPQPQTQLQLPGQEYVVASNNMAQIPFAMPTAPMMDQAMAGTYWFNDSGSPCFNNVDQLLSPGFSVPDNMFQSLFNGFDPGLQGVYDQMNPAPNHDSVGMLYNV